MAVSSDFLMQPDYAFDLPPLFAHEIHTTLSESGFAAEDGGSSKAALISVANTFGVRYPRLLCSVCASFAVRSTRPRDTPDARLWFTASPARRSNTCSGRYPKRSFSRANSRGRASLYSTRYAAIFRRASNKFWKPTYCQAFFLQPSVKAFHTRVLRLGLTPLGHDRFQHSRHSPAGEAGVHLQGQNTPGCKHRPAQHSDRSPAVYRIVVDKSCGGTAGDASHAERD